MSEMTEEDAIEELKKIRKAMEKRNRYIINQNSKIRSLEKELADLIADKIRL